MTERWGQHRVGGQEPVPPEASGNGVDLGLPAVPKPVNSSILWTPRAWDSAEPPEARGMDLFVWQTALREVASHLSTPGRRDAYGMLSGRLLRCPESDTSYLSIQEAHAAPHSMPESEDPADLARFREFWLSVSMKVSRHGQTLVGWYHAHPRLGIAFSKSDQRIHLAHFPNRWQCALVLTSEASSREAGFFQRDARTGVFRSTPAAFYEVLPAGRLNGGRAKSWVGWSNYKPDRSVKTSRRSSREAAFELISIDGSETVARSDPDALPGGGTNGNTGRAIGDGASAETGGAPAPTVLLPEFFKAREARRRRRRILRAAATAGILAVAAGGLAMASATGRVDLAAMAGDVRFQTRALVQALSETLIPTNQPSADGQAGAVPMARGQDPGAPSADTDMSFASPPSEAPRSLLSLIQEYERVRTAAANEGKMATCEALTTAFRRVEAAAASHAVDPGELADGPAESEGLTAALQDVRRDFEASSCSSPD